MTALRPALCLLVLGGLLACSTGARRAMSPEFSRSVRLCKQRAWASCGALWSCEQRVRQTCLAEQGWAYVDGQWRRGEDWKRAQEIDSRLEDAG